MNNFIFFAARRERAVEVTVAKTSSPLKVSEVAVKPRLIAAAGGNFFCLALSNGAVVSVGVDSFGSVWASNKNGLVLKNDLYTNKPDRDFGL
jgi:hypothetical protein